MGKGNVSKINGYEIADATARAAHNGLIGTVVDALEDLESKIPTGAAADKGVDTTISAASTSTNLPTSKAVAAFVEGKGYKTTDTKNTAGSTNSDSKLYLIGATSQAANPQTYSDSEVFTTNGTLQAKNLKTTGYYTVNNRYIMPPVYSYSNGVLINLGKAANSTMVVINITGNGYGNNPIDTRYTFYDYTESGGIINYKAVQYGSDLGILADSGDTKGTMYAYRYDGNLYAWVIQGKSFQTLVIEILTNKAITPVITNATKHTTDITNEIKIVPQVIPVSQGGTGLKTNPSMLVNLASASADTVFKTTPRPGVTGTLPIANGGTGASTAEDALANFGLTATVTELNYVDGVTSNIQTQLNGKLSTTGKAASSKVADEVAWDNVSGKPTFAEVATSGSYNDLSNKPTIPTSLPASDVSAWAKAATKPSYSYSEITGTPTLATVATSGSYNDLLNKPTIPAAYTLPVATSSARGGIKIGYTASNANIPVQLSNEKAYVALTSTAVTSALGYTPPETDTTYSVATASKAGLVKPVSVITKPTLNSVTTTSGKYYQVQMSSDGNMFVNVPWQAGTSVDLSGYATLASPTFTGTPKAPTAAKGTNTTQIATTAFVQSQGFVTSEITDDLVDRQELEDGTVDLSAYDFVGNTNNPNLTYYATDNGTTTTGTWLAKCDNVTSLFDGLSVKYKITKAGASTTTFNLNGLGAKTVYLRGTTKLTTHYAVNTMVHLIYSSSSGAWYCADYDTNSDSKMYQYYTLTTSDGEYPIIYSYTTDTGTSSYKSTYGAVCGRYTYNPSTDTVRLGAWSISGGDCSITNVDNENNYIYIGDDLVEIGGTGIGLYGDTTIAGQGSVNIVAGENDDAQINVWCDDGGGVVDISANEIRLNGTVTVNGEPIGGGGNAMYRHSIEISATIDSKVFMGAIATYDTQVDKHTATSLNSMYNGQTFEFSGFYGNSGGPYTFLGSITITGNGSGTANGLFAQSGTPSVWQQKAMTFTVNAANTSVKPL